MSEDVKDVDRPFHVVSILNGEEGFHSGRSTKESADARCKEANAQAEKLGIKTRYQIKENKAAVTPQATV